ncbi:MAG: hypothetical protein IJ111_05495 [Eggerthellaceae bacterium]|nr:hypothetical protein [Eggerthellaceae bacterium]
MVELSTLKLTAEGILKRGGEGSIYRIPGSNQLAKVYHPAARTDYRAKKVERMTRLKVTGGMSGAVAWPDEPITDNGKTVGFTMAKLDAKPLNRLLSNDECFKVDWCKRLKIVRSAAVTVASLHSAGVVVGDCHADNFGYTDSGGTVLYDADSLQLSDGRRLFPCTVAHDDCRPPEIANVDLSAKSALNERTDNYMLANLIFRILMGAHPYSGVRTSGSASSVSGAISSTVKKGEFAYETNPSAVPQYAAPYDVVGCLKPLFKCCFVNGAKDPSARPAALEWVQAIDKLSSEKMGHCAKHGSYPARMGSCPFCKAKAPTVKRPKQAAQAIARVPVATTAPVNAAAVAVALPAQTATKANARAIDAADVGWTIAKILGIGALVVVGIAAIAYLLPYILMGAIFIGIIASLD